MKRDRIATPDLCFECGASWDCEHTARKPAKQQPDAADRIAAGFVQADKESGRSWTWRERADFTLARLFDHGRFTPSPQEIFDAYPFGMRAYFPYKTWCEQVKWWKAGCPQPKRKKQDAAALPGQERLL